eukprot:jgi/Hompol1/5242/HPOL_004295-RA
MPQSEHSSADEVAEEVERLKVADGEPEVDAEAQAEAEDQDDGPTPTFVPIIILGIEKTSRLNGTALLKHIVESRDRLFEERDVFVCVSGVTDGDGSLSPMRRMPAEVTKRTGGGIPDNTLQQIVAAKEKGNSLPPESGYNHHSSDRFVAFINQCVQSGSVIVDMTTDSKLQNDKILPALVHAAKLGCSVVVPFSRSTYFNLEVSDEEYHRQAEKIVQTLLADVDKGLEEITKGNIDMVSAVAQLAELGANPPAEYAPANGDSVEAGFGPYFAKKGILPILINFMTFCIVSPELQDSPQHLVSILDCILHIVNTQGPEADAMFKQLLDIGCVEVLRMPDLKNQPGHAVLRNPSPFTVYCSKECQVADWKERGHKTVCAQYKPSTEVQRALDQVPVMERQAELARDRRHPHEHVHGPDCNHDHGHGHHHEHEGAGADEADQ